MKDELQRRWTVHRRVVRTGQALMVVGALVAVSHWLAHLEAFGPGQPPGWLDLVAGYPTGAIVLIIGAVLAGRKRPTAT
ncbi:MAG: hypothetical protein Q8M65_06710 [Rhodoglobus sp.]|nr:hypothetical protein [Rhodoglobus sp.]